MAERSKEGAERGLERALERVDSESAAERAVNQVEQLAEGVSEAQAGRGAALSPASVSEVAAEAAGEPDPARAAAVALTAVAAEVASPSSAAAPTLEAARSLLAPAGSDRPIPPGLVKPRGLLQREVLRRMSPLQAWDAWLFIAVNRLPHPRPVNQALYGLTVISTGGLCWMAGTLAAYALGVRRGRRACRELVPAVAVATWLVEHPIKAYFRRRRPFVEVVRALVIGKKPGSWSFPSGHTAASFGSAWVLSRIWPDCRPLFFGLAALVGFSRVYLGAHYPGDVLSGAAGGLLLTELCRRLLRRLGG